MENEESPCTVQCVIIKIFTLIYYRVKYLLQEKLLTLRLLEDQLANIKLQSEKEGENGFEIELKYQMEQDMILKTATFNNLLTSLKDESQILSQEEEVIYEKAKGIIRKHGLDVNLLTRICKDVFKF